MSEEQKASQQMEHRSDMAYVRLFHGRTEPNEELSDWGSDGPMIGPVGLTWTYGNLKLHMPGWDDFEWLPEIHDLVLFDGIYYGDLDIFFVGDPGLDDALREFKVVPYSEFIEKTRQRENRPYSTQQKYVAWLASVKRNARLMGCELSMGLVREVDLQRAYAANAKPEEYAKAHAAGILNVPEGSDPADWHPVILTQKKARWLISLLNRVVTEQPSRDVTCQVADAVAELQTCSARATQFDTRELLRSAEAQVAALRSQGWTQGDFAAALRKMLPEPEGKVTMSAAGGMVIADELGDGAVEVPRKVPTLEEIAAMVRREEIDIMASKLPTVEEIDAMVSRGIVAEELKALTCPPPVTDTLEFMRFLETHMMFPDNVPYPNYGKKILHRPLEMPTEAAELAAKADVLIQIGKPNRNDDVMAPGAMKYSVNFSTIKSRPPAALVVLRSCLLDTLRKREAELKGGFVSYGLPPAWLSKLMSVMSHIRTLQFFDLRLGWPAMTAEDVTKAELACSVQYPEQPPASEPWPPPYVPLPVVEQTTGDTENEARAISSESMADEITGIRESASGIGQYYLPGSEQGIKVTPEEAATAIWAGKCVEVPNAGAGSYGTFFASIGFTNVEVWEQSSSAGEWSFTMYDPGQQMWYAGFQSNRYPHHGFRYSISQRLSAATKQELYRLMGAIPDELT